MQFIYQEIQYIRNSSRGAKIGLCRLPAKLNFWPEDTSARES
jgi:hypothetical protein